MTGKTFFAHAIVLASTGAAACESPALDPPAATDHDVTLSVAALGGAGISLTGSGTQTPLAASNGFLQEWSSHFELRNTSSNSIGLTKQLFFFIAPGGWVYGKPSTEMWWPGLIMPPQSGPFIADGGWGFSAPVSHMIMRLDGKSGSTKYTALTSAPVTTPGFAIPGASGYAGDLNVGVIGPIEIVNLSSGQRWLPITGSIVDTTNTANNLTPSLNVTARNSSGTVVATLNTAFLPSDEPILPARNFNAWVALSPNASVAKVRIQTTLPIGGSIASQTKDIPVVNAAPLPISSPVAGVWAWDNSVGQTVLHAHTRSPEGRYAYDLCIKQVINGSLTSCHDDCSVNSNYFCWGQPIRAALGGTVVFVYDDTLDHNGNSTPLGPNNEVIIQHANGYYSRYAHLQKDSAVVSVGQTVAAGTVIGVVGNSGGSSGPHLHFHLTKLDSTNKQQAVPVIVNGLMTPDFVPLSGVPKGGELYRTP